MLFKFDKTNVYNKIDGIPLLQERIQKIEIALKDKYHVDYLGIHAMDNTREYMYSIRGHRLWHNYFWQNHMLNTCKAIQLLASLKDGENGMLFFKTYVPQSVLNARAEIFGARKAGFSVLFQSIMSSNRIMFCVTFANNVCISDIEKHVLLSLINDLYKCSHILNPFLSWFKQIGNLNVTDYFKSAMSKRPFHLPF